MSEGNKILTTFIWVFYVEIFDEGIMVLFYIFESADWNMVILHFHFLINF